LITVALGYYAYAIATWSALDGVQINFEGHQMFADGDGFGDLEEEGVLGLLGTIAGHLHIRSGERVFATSQVVPGAMSGSWDSVSVSTIKALAYHSGLDLDPEAVAELAVQLGQHDAASPAGTLCTYGSAYGGVCYVTRSPGRVVVDAIRAAPEVMSALEKNLMLFSRVHLPTIARDPSATSLDRNRPARSMARLGELATALRVALEQGNLDRFAALFHECWVEQERAGYVGPLSSQCYRTATEHGALGGQAENLENGGFLLVFCPPEQQDAVTNALSDLALERWPLTLEHSGVQIILQFPWPWANGSGMDTPMPGLGSSAAFGSVSTAARSGGLVSPV